MKESQGWRKTKWFQYIYLGKKHEGLVNEK